ncbi:DUF6262 family protein [Microbacterium lacticum]
MTADSSIQALQAATARKSAQKLQDGLDAIRHLVRTKQPVSISAVARQGGLSRPYISGNPTLMAEIGKHRVQPRRGPAPTPSEGEEASVTVALRNIIRDKDARHAKTLAERDQTIRDLRAESRQLREENARLRGRLRNA